MDDHSGAPGEPIPLLAIVGPTGVGKTAVAVALAADLPIEAIGVDSRQVYRRMDVGTGKPSASDRRRLPHHLLDVAEPDEIYDAARFVREARAAILDIRRRGRVPVLVGGTGLYYRALLRGLAPGPPADPELRRRLHAEALTEGRSALHRRLTALDPDAATRLHPHDVVRVTRALEVALLTGGPGRAGSWASGARPYRAFTIGLTADRERLDAALDARVDRMVTEGLVDEVGSLLAAGYAPSLPSMHGIGYRHLAPVVAGLVPLDEAVAAMKRDTRRYARRQWTWFAREEDVHWVSAEPGRVAPVLDPMKKWLDRTRLFDYPR